MMTPAVMFQDTGSHVGKSTIVAGLARLLARRGLVVRPFKPLNMSNNAAVTADGGEIRRAQALQARAAGIAPSVDMNPVLLKPQTGGHAQLVVQGHVRDSNAAPAADAYRHAFLNRLRLRADSGLDFDNSIDAALDTLANHLEQHLDIAAILQIAASRQ
jgi:adenosylcobyric acid synthase